MDINDYETGKLNNDVQQYDDLDDFKRDILNHLRTEKESWKEKINHIINSNGYTKVAFAELCEVSRISVGKWCKGSIPKSREMFIKIGFAAHYNLDQMNKFLMRYGKYTALYAKSLEDSVYIFVLNSNHIPHNYNVCKKILEKIHFKMQGQEIIGGSCYDTSDLLEEILNLSEESELVEFIQNNSEAYKEPYRKFYAYVEDFLIANCIGFKSGEVFNNCLAPKGNWSSSLRKCVYAIRKKQWFPMRRKVISLGLHLNMNLKQINDMLQLAQMETLCAKNPVELAIIYALVDADLNNVISCDGTNELCIYIKEILSELEIDDTEDFLSELEIDDTEDLAVGGPILVLLEMETVKSFSLNSQTQWTIGRSCPENFPDIPLQSPIAGRNQGQFQRIEGQWFYVDGKSRNGTFYNGQKIVTGLNGKLQSVALSNGDILRVDNSNLTTPDPRGVWMLFTEDYINGEWVMYSLEKNTTIIGRDPERCQIVQPLPYISSQHVKITYLNGNYYISDCNSKSGTWLNGERVEGSKILQEKDKISLCDCFFIFTGNSLLYHKQ